MTASRTLVETLLVAQREYLENVRTRGFWLSVLLVPLIAAVAVLVPVLLEETRPNVNYAVIDASGWLLARVDQLAREQELQAALQVLAKPPPSLEVPAELAGLQAQLHNDEVDPALLAREQATSAGSAAFVTWWDALPMELRRGLAPQLPVQRFQRVPAADPARLNAALEADRLFAYFVIPADPVAADAGALYVSRNLTNLELRSWFAGLVEAAVREQRLREQNISAETAAWVSAPFRFRTLSIADDGAAAEADLNDALRQWAPTAFVYLLWIAVFAASQLLLTNTVEEKSNKLVEVLVSSLSPQGLLAGKILGIALTSLTMMSAWALFVAAIVGWAGASGHLGNLDLGGLLGEPRYLASFGVYFVLGYLLFAAILAAIGALCSTLKEAHNMMLPVQLIMLVPILVMLPIGRDPNGMLATVLTWIPPFTPFVMMNRAAMPPPLWVYVGTTLLLLVSIWWVTRMAARIFRHGILMTGKPPGLRGLWALLRQRA